MIRNVSRSFIFIYGSGLSKCADKVIVSLESLSSSYICMFTWLSSRGIWLYLNLYFYGCVFLVFASVSVCAWEMEELRGLVTSWSDMLQGTPGTLLQSQGWNWHLLSADLALPAKSDYSTFWLVTKMQRTHFLFRLDSHMISAWLMNIISIWQTWVWLSCMVATKCPVECILDDWVRAINVYFPDGLQNNQLSLY